MNAILCTRPGDCRRAPDAARMLAPHRPWWKVAINTVLRAVQPQPRKWVVYSKFEMDTSPPRLVGYGFGRVFHLPRRARA